MNSAECRQVGRLREVSWFWLRALLERRGSIHKATDADWCISIGVLGAVVVALGMTVAAFIASSFRTPPLVAHAAQVSTISYSVPKVKVLGAVDDAPAADASKLAQSGAKEKQLRFIF